MKLAKFTKTPLERKRYVLDYSEWLDAGETLIGVIFSVTPTDAAPVVVDSSAISSDGLEIVLYVTSGTAGSTYTVDVKATTSGGQIKEDQVLFVVRNP